MEWWVSNSNENFLAGVDGSLTNPPMLTPDQIVEFLQHIPQARASYDRLFPTLLPEEQARLNAIVEGSPMLQPLTREVVEDNWQHRFVTMGVQRGGGWAPPPFPAI